MGFLGLGGFIETGLYQAGVMGSSCLWSPLQNPAVAGTAWPCWPFCPAEFITEPVVCSWVKWSQAVAVGAGCLWVTCHHSGLECASALHNLKQVIIRVGGAGRINQDGAQSMGVHANTRAHRHAHMHMCDRKVEAPCQRRSSFQRAAPATPIWPSRSHLKGFSIP